MIKQKGLVISNQIKYTDSNISALNKYILFAEVGEIFNKVTLCIKSIFKVKLDLQM